MSKDNAIKLALEAFKDLEKHRCLHYPNIVKALEEALTQEQGEPVTWNLKDVTDAYKLGAKSQQRTWVGLTRDEIQDLLDIVDHYNYPQDLIVYTQAKLKEKNN
jgi:hypothetical protein